MRYIKLVSSNYGLKIKGTHQHIDWDGEEFILGYGKGKAVCYESSQDLVSNW